MKGSDIWGIVPVVLFIGMWEIASRSQVLSMHQFVPPPSTVVVEFYRLAIEGELGVNFLGSLRRLLIGFCAGSLAGLLTGIMMGWSDMSHRTLHPLFSLFYPIPALGWLPLLMIWLGITEMLPIALIFISSFFPVLYNTITGIRTVPRNYIKVAETLGASQYKVLTTVIIPLALPNIFTGLRLTSGMAWRVIIAAEMVAIPTGIGALLMRAQSLIRIDIIIVCLIILSFMCLAFERFFLFMEEQLTGKWR
ncbi:MAG: ABC transporter permease [Deltaproteobacteria bacterium]|nr:ABC transporter permease [Deltaproteobacteria bacterium]